MGTMTGWVVETYEPDGGVVAPSWTLQTGENSVYQSNNCYPSIFYGGFDVHGKRMTATTRVATDTDDDFVGFVLGWTPGDTSSEEADYILIDWKRQTQGSILLGLAISRVVGDTDTADGELSQHIGKVTELARGITLGSTGYSQNTTYTFVIDVCPNRIVVYVNGNRELDITGSFSNGRFGVYDYSQPKATFGFIGYTELSCSNALMFSCNS